MGPLLAAASTLITLVGLEAALRFEAAWGLASPDSRPPPPPRGGVALGEILQPAGERRIVYALKPRLDVTFLHAHLTTDERGFRRSGAAPASGAAVRVIGIGDSLMFGWGVSDEETYLARLERQLRARSSARGWEVVNTAVPGYNTVMEIETLKRHASSLDPRIVILEVVGNDLDLPNFLQAGPEAGSWRRSFLFDFVADRMRRLAAGRPQVRDGEDALVPAPETEDGSNRHFEDDPSRVPAEYADLVGRGAFERSFRELARLRDERGFAVVVVSQAPGFDWFQHYSRRLSRELGFVYLDVGRILRRRVAELGFADFRESPLALSRDDPHPSALGHALAAEELYRLLVERGWARDDSGVGGGAGHVRKLPPGLGMELE